MNKLEKGSHRSHTGPEQLSPPWISRPQDSREAIRQAMITRIREARDQWKVGGKQMSDPARARIVGIVDALRDFNRKEGQR